MFGQIRKCSIVHFLQLSDALLDRRSLGIYFFVPGKFPEDDPKLMGIFSFTKKQTG